MIRGETDEERNDPQTRHFDQRFEKISLTRRNVKKSKSRLWKHRSLTNPENYVCVCVVYFTNLDDGQFKDTMKNTRRKLEVPMPAAIPCKIQRETGKLRFEKQCETKYA